MIKAIRNFWNDWWNSQKAISSAMILEDLDEQQQAMKRGETLPTWQTFCQTNGKV